MGDFAVGLLPQFRACGEVMRFQIIRIGKLVEHDAFASGL